ncbi:MAG: GAP family protein [Desulfovibrio sp.]
MPQEHVFLVALQSSLLLGIVHGINPCGHSWLALAPFVSGERRAARVLALTAAFLGGTALACLLLGLTLGAVSTLFPPSFSYWLDIVAGVVIILLGLVLVVRPHLLHDHDHDHEHEHDEEHDQGQGQDAHAEPHDHPHDHTHEHAHEEAHASCHCADPRKPSRLRRAAVPGLFAFGFVNMIVPCPTVAIMYSYALNSGSIGRSVAVFGAYALTTALAVGAVIWALFRAASWARRLNDHRVEDGILRGIGLMTVAFGVYSLYSGI